MARGFRRLLRISIRHASITKYHEQRPGDVPQLWEANFRAPRWLTRGWTLQQLIAPGEVEFYDVDWNPIGAIIELSDLIEDTTKTASRIIKHSQPRNGLRSHPHNELVARRMSWADYADRRHGILPPRNLWYQHAPSLRGRREGIHSLAGGNLQAVYGHVAICMGSYAPILIRRPVTRIPWTRRQASF